MEAIENKGQRRGLSVFERYLSLWVILCILAGIALGKAAPNVATVLDGMAIYVENAPVVSIPIAVCLFFMMYPIMVKIDFGQVLKAGKNIKPVGLTLFVNWAVKPFTMYAISILFLGVLFLGVIGPEEVDYVKMPLRRDLAVGDTYGAGEVVERARCPDCGNLVEVPVSDGAGPEPRVRCECGKTFASPKQDRIKSLRVPLWRSYLWGCILLGIAPCTAMVLVWGHLAKGNAGHTLVMVAINSLTMLLLCGPLGRFLLGRAELPVAWEALLLSIGVYVALPLLAGYFSRRWIIATKGEDWFKQRFLHFLTPVTIVALLVTLVLLFSFKGEMILSKPQTILWIAIPLFIQTNLIFWLGYGLARALRLTYADAAPSAMIGASNHFEVAIATAIMLFGVSSGAALATVVGVLIEVPVMLMLVKICRRTSGWFRTSPLERSQ